MGKGRDYLRKICFIALSSNAAISFAAVVDDEGKLIVGQSRRGNMIPGRKDPFVNTHYPVSNLFYLNYLIPTIKKGIITADVHLHDNSTKMQFELMHIADDNKIAISPLTGSKGKYLCVYFSRGINQLPDLYPALGLNSTLSYVAVSSTNREPKKSKWSLPLLLRNQLN